MRRRGARGHEGDCRGCSEQERGDEEAPERQLGREPEDLEQPEAGAAGRSECDDGGSRRTEGDRQA